MTAEGGGGRGGVGEDTALQTNRTTEGPWERFLLQHLADGTYAIVTNSLFYVTAINGGGVADPSGSLPFRTNAAQFGPDETFGLVGARDPTHLDLFMAGTDGTCWNISWDQATGWGSGWTAIHNQVKTRGGGPITAVYRNPAHLDLFMAGTDGTCWNISWDQATGWGSGWTAIQNRVKTTGGGPITAIYRDPTHLDLFMPGTDGTCWNISWDEGTGWGSGWTAIHNQVKTTGGGPITAIYRDPTHLDLFMAGTDGTCWNISWDQGTGWASAWTAIHNQVKTTGGGPITAVYRDPTHLDLFMPGTDGTCWNISWDEGTGWGSGWTAIHNQVKTTGHGLITAVYSDPTHLDLFMAGTDGTCWNISWDQATGWGSGWTAIQNQVKTTGGGPITAVYQDPTHLDLFMSGTDGTCWNISWDEGYGWGSAWTAIQNQVKTKGGARISAIWGPTS